MRRLSVFFLFMFLCCSAQGQRAVPKKGYSFAAFNPQTKEGLVVKKGTNEVMLLKDGQWSTPPEDHGMKKWFAQPNYNIQSLDNGYIVKHDYYHDYLTWSYDFGKTWPDTVKIKGMDTYQVKNHSTHHNYFQFLTKDKGYMWSQDGCFYRTDNGGMDFVLIWNPQVRPPSEIQAIFRLRDAFENFEIHDAQMFEDGTGFMSGAFSWADEILDTTTNKYKSYHHRRNVILRTRDNGEHWFEGYLPDKYKSDTSLLKYFPEYKKWLMMGATFFKDENGDIFFTLEGENEVYKAQEDDSMVKIEGTGSFLFLP